VSECVFTCAVTDVPGSKPNLCAAIYISEKRFCLHLVVICFGDIKMNENKESFHFCQNASLKLFQQKSVSTWGVAFLFG